MKSLYSSLSVAALLVGALLPCSPDAVAATVSIAEQVPFPLSGNAPFLPVPVPEASSGNYAVSGPGTVPGRGASPYAGNTDGLQNTALFTVLGAGGLGPPVGSATYNLGNNTVSLLWGTPDPFNQIQFFSGLNGMGTLLGTFTGSSLMCGPPCTADLVVFDVSSGIIGSAVLSNSTSPAFEFGGPVPFNATVPLPAAFYLFGTVLGGVFWLGRRKGTALGAALAA